MTIFEFRFIAACGTPLQIGVVEAPSLVEAVSILGGYEGVDADAVRLTIEEQSFEEMGQ